jgi:hypothetical protein
MHSSCESDSNEIDESDSQQEKHDSPRFSTLRGMTIDFSEQNRNAQDSMFFSCEFDSKETDESDLQCEKHFKQRISTLRGMTIEFSEGNSVHAGINLTGTGRPEKTTTDGRKKMETSH